MMAGFWRQITIFANGMKTLPAIILLFLILAGCTSRSDRRTARELDRIDAMMDVHPDSALEALRALPVDSTTTSPSLRARHGLLLSRAYYKNFIELTSDSILSPALSFYAPNSDDAALGEALFYYGRILENQCSPDRALHAYLEAEKAFLKVNDHCMLGKTYQQISGIFYNLFFEKESFEYGLKALDEFEIYGDSAYIGYADYNLGNVSCFSDRYEDAIRYSTKALDIAARIGDRKLYFYPIPVLARSNMALGDRERAYGMIKKMDAVSLSSLNDVEKLALIEICNSMGDRAMADSLYGTIQSTAVGPLDYLVSEGRYREAYETLSALTDSMNNIICEMSRQNLTSVINDFNKDEMHQAVREKNITRRNALLTVAVSTIVLILVILLYRKAVLLSEERRRNMEIQEEKSQLIIRSLTHELKESEIARLAAKKDLENAGSLQTGFLKSSYRHLDSLCKSFNEADSKKSASASVYEDVKSLIDGFRPGGRNISPLEDDINALTGEAVSRLRDECTNLSEDDYHLMLLSIAGFSPFSIALFVGTKPNTVYGRKFRLKEKLAKFHSRAANEILSLLK